MTGPTDAERRGAVIVRAWLLAWAAAVAEQRTWLTDLDAAIGDGDHGINLDRGLAAVADDLVGPARDTRRRPAGTCSSPPGGGSWASSAARAARSTAVR